MTQSQPHLDSQSNTTNDSTSVADRVGLFQDATRAQASQIDFMNAMIILLLGIGLFLAASSVILTVAESSGSAEEYVAQRSAERVADDVLLNSTGDSFPDAECTAKFFTQDETYDCPSLTLQNTSDPDSEYLRHMLGVSTHSNRYTINVTLEQKGRVWTQSLDGSSDTANTYALGPSRPEKGGVTTFTRHVTYDSNGDGDREYFTVVIRVWS